MVLGLGGQGSDKTPRYSGGFSGASSGGGGTYGRGHSSRPFHSALQISHGAPGGRGPYMPYSNQPAPISAPHLQSFQSGYSGRQGQFAGQQSQHPRSCCTCGDPRHIARYCPRVSRSSLYQSSRAMVLAPAAALPAQPARGMGQVARGRG
nr:DNA-binding protein HEXBP-like [Nicotiana tomentosiformis]